MTQVKVALRFILGFFGSILIVRPLTTRAKQTDIVQAVSPTCWQCASKRRFLRNPRTPSAESAQPSPFPLPWSHYVRLLSVSNRQARSCYESESLRGAGGPPTGPAGRNPILRAHPVVTQQGGHSRPRSRAGAYRPVDPRTGNQVPSGSRGIGELSYPFHDGTALVTYCGRICIFKKKINLSTSLAGKPWASRRSTTVFGL